MRRTAVVALGGNAFTREGQSGTYAEQVANALTMAHSTNAIIESGWNVAIVHGKGPQVGNLAIQQEEGAPMVPPQPLFALGAMTEAHLGSLIVLSLRRASHGRVEPVAVVTHTVVSLEDPAFAFPSKPIGPFVTAQDLTELAGKRGWTMAEDSGRGYRRMVPSPRPIAILEINAIRAIVERGDVVVAAGGGGIPVVQVEDGYTGVDAVVDKDYAAEKLASSIAAEALVLVTGVAQVQLDFGRQTQRPIELMTAAEAERHLVDGQFPEGSMGPKIRAAIRFLRNGGKRVVITTPELAADALEPVPDGGHRVGTTIVLSDTMAGVVH